MKDKLHKIDRSHWWRFWLQLITLLVIQSNKWLNPTKHYLISSFSSVPFIPKYIPHLLLDCREWKSHSSMVYEAFKKNPQRRHRHFKRFFAATNPLVPLPSRKTHPNHKVQKFFKHAMKQSKSFMFIGRYISGDEQTVGTLLLIYFNFILFIH